MNLESTSRFENLIDCVNKAVHTQQQLQAALEGLVVASDQSQRDLTPTTAIYAVTAL